MITQKLVRSISCMALLLAAAVPYVAADDPDTIVFSTKSWQGEYYSHDIAGGVAEAPIKSAVYTIRADGSGMAQVADLGKTEFPRFSPDGKWIYFQSDQSGHWQVYRCRPDGSQVTNIARNLGLGEEWYDVFGYALSSGGEKMTLTLHNGKIGRAAVANLDGTDARFMAPKLGYTYMAQPSPDGRSIVFSGPAHGYRLLIVRLAGGEPEMLTPDHPSSIVPQFTPDSKTIVFLTKESHAMPRADVYRVDVDGKNLRRLTEGNGYCTFTMSKKDLHGSSDPPDISPDGRRIAYIARRDDVLNVWTMNLDGTGARQITHRPSSCGRVKWSPDGKRLAFVSFVDQAPQLFVVDAAAKNEKQLTHLPHAVVYFLAWKPRSG